MAEASAVVPFLWNRSRKGCSGSRGSRGPATLELSSAIGDFTDSPAAITRTLAEALAVPLKRQTDWGQGAVEKEDPFFG